MAHVKAIAFLIQFLMQRLALVVFAFVALATLTATAMAAFGALPWIEFTLRWNGVTVPQAGMYVQIGVAFLALGLCFFLPSNRRIFALENSHRQFSIGMNDVARAYGAVHAADRGQTFRISSEFDSVRERLAYLRDHPDLSTLEPSVLEVAAQMSHVSRELAEVYADERVARARSFLEQRQFELEQFNHRLDHAKIISSELKHWHHEIELEESVAAAQLSRLKDQLRDILPELGPELGRETIIRSNNTIVGLTPKAAE